MNRVEFLNADTQFSDYEHLLLGCLTDFFDENPDYFNRFKDIKNGLVNKSLRTIERENDKEIKDYAIIYNGKQYFDPFCRGRKFKYNGIETSIGQLNFFKWLFTK